MYEEHLGGEKTRLILGTDNSLLELIKGDILKTEDAPASDSALQ